MKDNKLKLFSLILSAVLIAGGCAKDNTEGGNYQEDQDSELPENVFNENITQYFTEVTGSYIRVSSDIPDSRLPEEGAVIVCLATENTPYGYLGRIMSIEETTDGYVWHTGPAALTDAFESLHMDESIDAMAQVEEMVDEDGKRYDFEIVDNSIWDEINPVKDEDEKEELVKPSERDANGNIAYSDERFQTIEKARKKHLKLVKKLSYIKVAITFGGLAIVLCGWLIPAYTMKDPGRIPTYIGLALAVLTVVAICVYGILSKKKQVKSTEEYLASYFKECDEYLFEGLPISNLQGGMKEKITDDEFNGSDLYGPCSKHEEVSNIGSRDSLTFEYDGMKCALADVGAEARTPKGFLTVFIGKYLRTENHLTVDDGGLFVYIKGGPRSTPPSFLFQKDMLPLEDTKKYCIFGKKSNKKLLTKEFRQAIKNIHTDNLLIDLAISFKSGKTYWAMGYEDTLMVAPVDKPFDPIYLTKYKEQLHSILELAKTL